MYTKILKVRNNKFSRIDGGLKLPETTRKVVITRVKNSPVTHEGAAGRLKPDSIAGGIQQEKQS